MLHRYRTPDWLYERLPFIYGAVGVLTIVVLQNGMALLSGATLISAGAMIWLMRKRLRAAPLAHSDAGVHRVDDAVRAEHADAKLIQLIWRKSYECGHPVIDAQHGRLFDLGNVLINALVQNQPKSSVEPVLDELVEHVRDHFCAEEALLARCGYPLADHAQVHRALLERAARLRERYHEGAVAGGDLVGFIAYDVIAQHIIMEDTKWAKATGLAH